VFVNNWLYQSEFPVFPAKELTLEDGEFYQFCYLTGNNEVQGVSIPFQFVMDDFEIVPDVSLPVSNSEEQPGDSFVHAEVC
jgi:SKICH domain